MVNMKIDHFVVGPVQTNCYFVTNIKTKEMIIIDPVSYTHLTLPTKLEV